MNSTDALITILGAAVIGLVSYIFLAFRSDTQGRFRHLESLIEEMVKNNASLSKITADQSYRIRTIEDRLKIEPTRNDA